MSLVHTLLQRAVFEFAREVGREVQTMATKQETQREDKQQVNINGIANPQASDSGWVSWYFFK